MTFEQVAEQLHSDARLSSSPDVLDRVSRSLAATFTSTSGVYDRRRAICAQIGASDDRGHRQALSELRERFDASAVAAMVREAEEASRRSPAEGWMCWLRFVSAAIGEFNWEYAQRLCEHPFVFDRQHDAALSEVRRGVRCMQQSRWDEVEDVMAWLAAQEELPAATRARMLSLLAQIELIRFSEPKRATALLARAEDLAPRDVVVLATVGDLHVKQGDAERAISYFNRAIEVAPTESNGYVSMGELSEKEDRVDDAARWYTQAIEKAGGDVSGYDRLLGLRDLVVKDHVRYLELMERRNAVDPGGEYDAYRDTGDRFKAFAQESQVCDEEKRRYLADARSWYERARLLHEDWPLAYTSLAELCKSDGHVAEAETWAKKATQVSPECPSGYLSLGPLYEEQQRWTDALRVFSEFPERPRRWKLYATCAVARLRARLGEVDAAHQLLLGVLREEAESGREQVFAETELENLAQDAYKKRDDAATALKIFDQILAATGERYKARYHHLVGNLHYYHSEFDSAANHYRFAIAAAPTEPTYYHYLSDALRSASRFEEAQIEIDRAFARDGDEVRRNKESATLANTQGNRAFERGAYRDAISHYTRAIKCEPSTAVYCSNLARAYELLKEPGKRIEHLNEARRRYTQAQQVAGDQQHAHRLDRLQRRVELAETYGEEALDWESVVTAIGVEVTNELVPHVAGPTATGLSVVVEREVDEMRSAVSKTLGISVPGVRFFGSERALPAGTFVVFTDEVPVVSDVIAVDKRFFAGTPAQLTALGITAVDEGFDPVTGDVGAWVAQKDWETLKSDARLWTITRYLLRRVEAVVRRNASQLIGHQELVVLLQTQASTMRDAIAGSPGALDALTNVCRGLLAENVPIRPFDQLCATFKQLHDEGVKPRDIVERVRLTPQFRENLPGRDQRSYLRTSERFEDEIRRSLYRQGHRMVLAMTPARCQAALAAVRSSTAGVDERSVTLVVADQTLRPFVRRLIEFESPDLAVLSVAETRDGAEYLQGRVDLELTLPGTADFRSRVRTNERPTRDLPANRSPHTDFDATVEVIVGRGFQDHISSADDKLLPSLLSLLRSGLFSELGVLVPPVQFVEREEPGDEFAILINGREQIRTAGLAPNEFFANATVDNCSWLGIDGRQSSNPATGAHGAIVTFRDADDDQKCRTFGFSTWGPAGYLVLHLSAQLRRAAALLQTDRATRHQLDSIAANFPDLVRVTVERFPLATITRVLQHLLAEEISIRNLRGILEALLCLSGSSDVDMSRFIAFNANAEPICFDPLARPIPELLPRRLADYVRTCLKRYISNKYTRGSNSLPVYLLDPALEAHLRDLADRQPDESTRRRFIDAVAKGLQTDSTPAQQVLLTNVDVRSTAKDVLRDAFPDLSVVSFEELLPDINISQIARIH
jgi:type III secretory pathway component EscV/tetratricopeptide (TPR) repeat protein